MSSCPGPLIQVEASEGNMSLEAYRNLTFGIVLDDHERRELGGFSRTVDSSNCFGLTIRFLKFSSSMAETCALTSLKCLQGRMPWSMMDDGGECEMVCALWWLPCDPDCACAWEARRQARMMSLVSNEKLGCAEQLAIIKEMLQDSPDDPWLLAGEMLLGDGASTSLCLSFALRVVLNARVPRARSHDSW